MLGSIMIFSTTSAEVLDHSLKKSTHLAFLKQLAYACAGGVVGIVVSKLGYRRFIQISPTLLIILTIFLVLALIPGIGREVNGSKRWVGLAGISFQPSEFVKYVLPAFVIYYLQSFQSGNISFNQFLRLIGIVFIPMLLILIEPNNGTTAVIGICLLVIFWIAEIPFKFWAFPLLGALLIGGIFASQLPYVTGRLKVYLNPELDLKGKGHQPHQAKIAAGSGQFLGRGPGNSLQKLSYLPEAQNDYIAAIFAEEFGFLGIFCLICLYLLFSCLGFAIAFQAKDTNGFYFAALITFLIGFQAFMNLGVVSNLLPSTGLNLPFFSQGGTSLIANFMGISLLMSIYSD